VTDTPEWKKAAQAMKAAADEDGVDFMTSPLSDIVKTLEKAAQMESGFRPLRPCGES
jgi:hypothetical protein